MPAIVTAMALCEADSLLGVLCELLVESLEVSLPPLKSYLAIRGLGDFGPLIPEWSGAGGGPGAESSTVGDGDACSLSDEN